MEITDVHVTIIPSLRPNLPSVLASAIVTLDTPAGPITIHDCRILENKNGVCWFSPPTFSVPLGGRQFEYRQTLGLPAELAREISAAALRAYEEWQAKAGGVR
jgi:DNA-binding cell septation regulator SpoVG